MKSLCTFILLFASTLLLSQPDYFAYHKRVVELEKQIVREQFSEALDGYKALFVDYDFVFKRDYQVAAQLALLASDTLLAGRYFEAAIAQGSHITRTRKIKCLRSLVKHYKTKELKAIQKQYEPFNVGVRDTIELMFKADQRLAFRYLFRFGQKAKKKYAERKFAPHSEQQLNALASIIDSIGFPSEKIIGRDTWASTILSHHNSISMQYNTRDTLYLVMRADLRKRLSSGEISPFEFAIIESWRASTVSGDKVATYGYLGPDITANNLAHVNKLRKSIGMRSIELRNALIDVQDKFGMDLALPGSPWQSGKIEIVD